MPLLLIRNTDILISKIAYQTGRSLNWSIWKPEMMDVKKQYINFCKYCQLWKPGQNYENWGWKHYQVHCKSAHRDDSIEKHLEIYMYTWFTLFTFWLALLILVVPFLTKKTWCLIGVTEIIQMSHLTTKPTKWPCAQQRLRSTSASAQSDQYLHFVLNG